MNVLRLAIGASTNGPRRRSASPPQHTGSILMAAIARARVRSRSDRGRLERSLQLGDLLAQRPRPRDCGRRAPRRWRAGPASPARRATVRRPWRAGRKGRGRGRRACRRRAPRASARRPVRKVEPRRVVRTDPKGSPSRAGRSAGSAGSSSGRPSLPASRAIPNGAGRARPRDGTPPPRRGQRVCAGAWVRTASTASTLSAHRMSCVAGAQRRERRRKARLNTRSASSTPNRARGQ